MLSIGWAKTTGFKRFTGEETPNIGSEWHNIYYGNNATKLIDITAKQLPAGVAMDIRQSGSEFSIHLTTYEEADILNQIDIHSMLLEARCIEK